MKRDSIKPNEFHLLIFYKRLYKHGPNPKQEEIGAG